MKCVIIINFAQEKSNVGIMSHLGIRYKASEASDLLERKKPREAIMRVQSTKLGPVLGNNSNTPFSSTSRRILTLIRIIGWCMQSTPCSAVHILVYQQSLIYLNISFTNSNKCLHPLLNFHS